MAKSIFRSVDVEFQNNVQRLSRLNEVFKEEVNLAHRQHIEDHVKEQRLAKAVIERIAAQSEPKPQQKPDDIIQKGSSLDASFGVGIIFRFRNRVKEVNRNLAWSNRLLRSFPSSYQEKIAEYWSLAF